MKILYLGTVCAMKRYEILIKTCKSKPTIASIVFESALIDGFKRNNADVQILSYPMIPVFPNSRSVFFGGHTEKLYDYRCRWLHTINLPLLKQLSRRADACHIIKEWAKENKGDGVILTYSIPPFLVKDILRYGNLYGLKTVAIIPDLLENMYINHIENSFVNMLKQQYLNKALKFQGNYDGYIYLTEAMREKVSNEKPYIVMEGILDCSDITQEEVLCLPKRSIMYAGCMHEKYGVLNLVKAFTQLSDIDAELWLFGEGTASNEIKERAKEDPRIKYFGRVARAEVLEYEKKATLLVNPRSVKEKFTKYSFPSKIIEYMASGTPLLTTRLEGIPEEYFDYVYNIEDNDVVFLKDAILKILCLADQDLVTKGKLAQQFVLKHKNAKSQVKRIINFFEKLSGENHGDIIKEKI